MPPVFLICLAINRIVKKVQSRIRSGPDELQETQSF